MSHPERVTGPSVVILHDVEHQDYRSITEGMALEYPSSVFGYIDGSSSPGLEDQVASARYVLIQNSLLEQPTADAVRAVRVAWLQGMGRTGLMAFGEDYQPEAEPLRTMLAGLAEEEVAI